jgi:ketosteroid isomerase-like protein
MTRKTRKLVLTLAILLVVSPFSRVFAQNAPAESAVKARMQAITAAWGTMDAAKIKPFYTTDPDAVIFDLSPLQYHGATAYIAGSQQEFADSQSLSLTIRNDARVHAITPDAAWATATVDISLISKAGRKQAYPVRWTSIWEKTGGNWIIVHEHWSVPAPTD